jgi:serine/threonine-protein kinase
MDQLPRRIGQYTVAGILGEGATGKVYLAEQAEPLRRTVAIKVLEAIERSDRVFARFEIERLALAVMDHPAIAKIHDAGITDDGHPYVVMERVDGVPIGRYCDDNRLTIRQRVELFSEACRAVHHAHQKGVVHRDLKPSHLMVTEVDGRPRLRIIDFGIAMALERGGHLDVGRDESEIVGTPGYMSPEQMEGSSDIDTRSDIYSLGVVLYELLVGVPPFDPGKRIGWAAVAAQLEDLPTPTRRLTSLEDTQDTLASHRRTTPRGLKKALSGDLDCIVTRAMSKNREHRYGTAKELWLDLERYLGFESVEAREGGPLYRAGRFARRHRVGVGFAGLIAAGVVAFAFMAAAQAARVAQARDEAEARRSQAEALIDFMLTDLRERLQPLGRLDIMDALGAQALDYFAATPERDIDDQELFRRVTTMQQIGQVRLDQGDLPAAREAFDGALRVNLELVGRAPANTDWLMGLGASHYHVGYVHWRVRELDAALEHFQRYLAIATGLVERDPSNPDFLTELAYAHSNIGSVLQARGEPAAAVAQFRAMRDALVQLLAIDPDNTGWQRDLAETYNTVGYALMDQGALPEAIAEFQEEVRLKRALVALDSTNAVWRARLGTGHNYLGQALEMTGDLPAAMAQYEEAVRLWTELASFDSTNVRWRQNLAMNQQQVASVLGVSGDLVGALDRLRAVGQVRRDLAARDPSDPVWRRDEAETYIATADVLRRLGRTAEARSTAQDALSILDALVEEGPPSNDLRHVQSSAYNVAGAIRSQAGEASSAREAWMESVRVIEPLASGLGNVRYMADLARALLHLDQVDRATPFVRRLAAAGYRESELAELAASRGVENSLHPLRH